MPAVDFGHIPVIDIEDASDPETLAAIDTACREWGFFQVVNHGIENATIERLMRETHAFFEQPTGVKRAVARTAENPWGFYDRELTKNTPDWKEIYDYGPADGESMQPQWPRGQPGFAPAVIAFYDACEAAAFRLLAAVSTNLGMHAEHLNESFRRAHTSYLRLNYYPTCPTPERPDGVSTPAHGHLAINHHTDAGALTLLTQDEQPGLEVHRNGAWCLVEPRGDALVVNIGDMVQVWSNDRYRAPLHRVLANANAARFSAPFFFNPAYATDCYPLPTTVDDSNPPRYRPVNWGDFRGRRAAGDYADYGPEVQITDYAAG